MVRYSVRLLSIAFILMSTLMLFSGIAFAQGKKSKKDDDYQVVVIKDETTGQYAYEGVVPVEGKLDDEMFENAKSWILANFKTSDNNIQFDKENKTINNSATILIPNRANPVWSVINGMCNFKLNIQFKDGRYRFVIDNLLIQYTINATLPVQLYPYEKIDNNKAWNRYIRKEVNQSLYAITVQLDQAIRGTLVNNKSDDW